MFFIRQIVFHWVVPLKCGSRVATNQGLGDSRRSVVCRRDLSKSEKILSKLLLAKADRKLFSLSFCNWFVFLAPIYNPARYVILCLLFFFLGSPPSFSFPSLVLLALKQSVLRCVICIFLMVYGCVEPLVGGGGGGGSLFGL